MVQASQRMSVTSAELVRRFGRWQDHAATNPLFVTHHGRERFVMLSAANYRALVDGSAAADEGGEDDRLEALSDLIAQGFIAFDEGLAITRINPVAVRYLRGHRQRLLGKRLEDIYPGVTQSLLETHLLRALRSGETGAFETPSFTTPDEWLHIQTFPFGQGVAILFRNISHEVETRRQAAYAAANLAAAAAHGGIGCATLSPRGTFIEVDRQLAEMAGFAPAALRWMRPSDILPLKRRVEAGEQVEAVLNGAEPRAFDTELLVNRGGELPVRIALAGVHSDRANEGAMMIVTPR